VSQGAAGPALAGLHGFARALTSFVGRASQLDDVAALLREYRLVTVTGPGGVGKTRLATEVAGRVADQFADGVWLVELAAVSDPTLAPAAVATALGLHQAPEVPVLDSLVMALARQQLLLVLDNCEHLLTAVAKLCAGLLSAADDVRVLVTSREPVGTYGEARYRLPPMELPRPEDRAGASEAVRLFAARARLVDSHFALDGDSGPPVARLVKRLDGMPLAIELAAARVEALGLAQLVDRLDDRFRLLTGTDRSAPVRQRSLTATADWSYQLLSEEEQRVFRWLAVFPASFTLDAAGAVAGPAAEQAVLHLVDCSLLTPPQRGPDRRARYVMLESLRAYGADRLTSAGEQSEAAAALARYALQVAEQAAMATRPGSEELAAQRWLDAEEATLSQGLTWALEHDRATALRLAIALAPWWTQQGRTTGGYALLRSAAADAGRGEHSWCAAQYWLGVLASYFDMAQALDHYTEAVGAAELLPPSPTLVDALANQGRAFLHFDRFPEARESARRALALGREFRYPAGQARALIALGDVAQAAGQIDDLLALAWEAASIDPASIPGKLARMCAELLTRVLVDAGRLDQARQRCAVELTRAREAGDLVGVADFLTLAAGLELRLGDVSAAAAHIRQGIEISSKVGYRDRLLDCLDACGHLCAARQRWADALTAWAAHATCLQAFPMDDLPEERVRRQQASQKAEQELGPVQTRTARERGAAMTLGTATEFAVLLSSEGAQEPGAAPDAPRLSIRERELVTLVAQGRTNAQIAGQLFISISTVGSHLDRIRDKTGCRRRTDLTRLALQAGLA